MARVSALVHEPDLHRCPQFSRYYSIFIGDEDCLYLNIWTAAKSTKERRPVMVWIHGGGFTRGSGSSASYDGEILSRKGVVLVPKADGVTEDDVLAAVLDAGAEDVMDLGQSFEVISEPTDLVTVRTAVTDAGLEYESAEAAFLPTVEVDLDEDQAKRVFRLIEALEDSDDVQDVYANYSVSDEIMEKLG